MRWVFRLVFVLCASAISFAPALLAPTPAYAHAVITDSDPRSGSLLTAAPSEVQVTFNEPVARVGNGLTVIAPNGDKASVGKASVADNGRVLIAKLRRDGPQGTYLVSYRLVSADGHPVSGGFTYSVGRTSTTPTAPEDETQLVDPLVRAAMSTGRLATYVGACLIAGAVLMLLTLWPSRLDTAVVRRLGWAGWWALVAGTVLWLVAQVPYGFGGGLFTSDSAAWRETLSSELGISLLIRLALLAAVVPWLRRVLSGGDVRRGARIGLWGLLAAVAATFPFAGHPASSVGKYLAIPADAVHVAAMAIWLGGLIVLVAVTLRRANERELVAILPTWSRWALLAIGAVILTGAVQALLAVGHVSALTSTRYGALVLAKIAGVVVIAVLAACARRWVLGYLRQRGDGIQVLRRVVIAEIVAAAVVLGVATALVQTPPANTVADTITNNGSGFGDSITTDDFTIDFQLNPARRGNNTLHLYAFKNNGDELFVVEWKTTVALPDKDIAPVSVPVVAISDNHASGEIYLPSKGEWEFSITVRTSDVDQTTLKQRVPIT